MIVEVCPICDIAGCRHIRERADLTAAKDARIAELERQLADARGVKLLEWQAIEQDRGDGSFDMTGDWTAETPFSGYSIVNGWGTDSYIFDVYYGEAEFVSSHDDPGTAKSAAQADYTARIISALKETKP